MSMFGNIQRTITFAERFWSKVVKGAGCWVWTASKNKYGYGQVKAYKKMMGAHRCAWILTHGEIPEGLHVLHACDNPPCVRPDHLFLGTNQDNMNDRDQKHRQASGELVGTSKLKAKSVAEIRALYQTGDFTQKQLGEQFGVTDAQVSLIVNNKSWEEPDDQ